MRNISSQCLPHSTCPRLAHDPIGRLARRIRKLQAHLLFALRNWIKLSARRADLIGLKKPPSFQFANGLAHSNGPGGISTDGVRSVLPRTVNSDIPRSSS